MYAKNIQTFKAWLYIYIYYCSGGSGLMSTVNSLGGLQLFKGKLPSAYTLH